MKASELITQLHKLIEQHGDKEVYSGGEDYPGRVQSVYLEKYGNAYTPKNTFTVRGGL